MYYDAHCHIYKEYYNDIDKVINELKKEDIRIIINNGCNQKSNEEVLSLVKKYPLMYGALGIHPENVDNYTEEDLEFIETNLGNDKILAIGEIGLDYYYTKDNKNKQIELFNKQLEIAESNNLPVIIHSREATKDTIDILKMHKVKGIIHCFSGSYETANIYINMGFKLGINGIITFTNSKLKDVIKRLDLKDLVIETDSPYLTPHPFRNAQNSPKNVKIIVDFLADLFKIDSKKVEEITSKNLMEIFDIKQ